MSDFPGTTPQRVAHLQGQMRRARLTPQREAQIIALAATFDEHPAADAVWELLAELNATREDVTQVQQRVRELEADR